MDKKGAQTAVVISALASFAIVSIHDITKGKPNVKAYIGGAFVFLLLAAGADVEPELAGPFAYLVLSTVVLTDGTSVLKSIGSAKAPTGDKKNAINPDGSPVLQAVIGGPTTTPDFNTLTALPPSLGGKSGDALAQLIVRESQTFLGTPYVFGGSQPGGFDCSGFVYYLGQKYGGVQLPRTAQEQARAGTPIARDNIEPGDLVFFTISASEGGEGTPNDHEGMYIGGGKFIQAPHTGDVVKISSLSDSFYSSHLTAIRRVF